MSPTFVTFPSHRRAAVGAPGVRHLSCLVLVAWLTLAAACAPSEEPLPEVSLIGERIGVMVWRPVEGATRYTVEIRGASGAVEFATEARDSVAPLGPTYTPDRGTSWQVRAYAGEREIARSTLTPLY